MNDSQMAERNRGGARSSCDWMSKALNAFTRRPRTHDIVVVNDPQLSYIRTFNGPKHASVTVGSGFSPNLLPCRFAASARGLMRSLAITAGGDFHSAPRTIAQRIERQAPTPMMQVPALIAQAPS
jgi:hypothetical protein